jgi:hypothetical protein
MTCQTGHDDVCALMYTACSGGYVRAWRLGDLGTVNYANKVCVVASVHITCYCQLLPLFRIVNYYCNMQVCGQCSLRQVLRWHASVLFDRSLLSDMCCGCDSLHMCSVAAALAQQSLLQYSL